VCWASGRNITKQMADNALRQVVSLDLIADRELLQFGGKPPVPANDALNKPLMREMIEPLVLSISLSRRVDQRQIPRLTLRVRRFALVGEKKLLERNCDFLSKSDTNKAAGSDRVAVPNEQDGLCRRYDLAFLGTSQIGQGRVLVHGVAPEINAILRHLADTREFEMS